MFSPATPWATANVMVADMAIGLPALATAAKGDLRPDGQWLAKVFK
jgi:hypothetical protein